MRLLQIQLPLDGGDQVALDLHPMMTVVSGLDSAGRERVIDVVRNIPAGRAVGDGGLVEAHGVLFDLSTETLELLGLASDLDPLVRSTDLPGAADIDDVLPFARITTEQFLASTAEGVHPELDAARRRQRSARETLSILRDAADRARREYTEAASAARAAAAAVAAAEPADELGTPDDVSGTPAPPVDRDELERRQAELTAQVTRVDQGLAELSGLDTRPIQVLLDAIRDPSPVELVPSERAAQLADEFVALQAQVDELEEVLEAEGRGTASALARLETARADLAAAERAMQKPSLSPEDIVELEAAHEAVLEAESGMSGLLRRGGQKRFEEAQAAEQAVLDRVGFPTWSAYVMGAGLLGIDPIAEQRLDEARRELEVAEAHWAEVAAMVEADPAHSALLDRLEAVYLEAFDLLGGDDGVNDLEAALRAFKEPKREVTTDELVDALAYQLSLVGLDLGADPGIDRTLLAADAFLAEVQGISDRVAELQAEHDAISAELADIRRHLERLDAEPPTIDITDAALAADVAAPGSGRASEADLDELRAALERAAEDERDYAEQLDARTALVDAATRVEAVASSRLIRLAAQLAEEQAAAGPASTEAPRPASDPEFEVGPDELDDRPESIEFYLLARLAAVRALSFAGSVPIVLDDTLAELAEPLVVNLLNKLERMSESVQIIYLTDDPTVLDWAGSIGLDRAAVVTPPGQLV